MAEFIGRDRIIGKINGLSNNRTANLVIVKGRRRIGKSRLVTEFAANSTFYHFEGLMPREGITAQNQREAFAKCLERYFGLPALKADDWGDLFMLLAKYVEKDRVIILFDEVSWMAQGDLDFLGKLKVAWDNYFKKNEKLFLFLCSSISLWFEENLVGSSGYLGRPTLDILLEELSLPVCNKFLHNVWGYASNFEKLKLLSVTGGVPRYLELINSQMTAEQNIQSLFFDKESPLFDEFERIFNDVYSKSHNTYKAILRYLVNTKSTQKGISEHLGIAQSGNLSEHLKALELGGFIARDVTWNISTGKISNLSRYRLKDNYTRFYLKYIEPNRERIKKDLFSGRSLSGLPEWNAIMGFQFENLVLNNQQVLLNQLGVLAQDVVFANPYFQRKQSRQAGCQIDYLVQTRESVYVFEIKLSRHRIGKAVISEVKDKLKKLKAPKYISRRAVLIHVNGVTDDLEDAQFFTKIIDFGELL